MSECECCSAEGAGSGEMACLLPEQPLQAVPANCPVCGSVGKRVVPITLKAMLAVSLTEIREVEYRFCPQADCPVIYFSEDHVQTFTESELRERVFQKHVDDDEVFVCYCFRHTVGAIRREFLETGASTVAEAVNAGIRAGKCACDLRNPQGLCCLGNINATVKRLQAQVPDMG